MSRKAVVASSVACPIEMACPLDRRPGRRGKVSPVIPGVCRQAFTPHPRPRDVLQLLFCVALHLDTNLDLTLQDTSTDPCNPGLC